MCFGRGLWPHGEGKKKSSSEHWGVKHICSAKGDSCAHEVPIIRSL